jgi:hypothetical protein
MDNHRLSRLPDEFRFSHLVCENLADRLFQIHDYVAKGPFWEVEITFRSKEDAQQFSGLGESEIISWLEANDYGEVIGDIMLKQVFMGLLGDMYEFISEALHSSAHGRATAALALLRKPLKENLFYLEWMLADTSGMLTALFNDSPAQISMRPISKRERAVPIITKAIAQIPYPSLFDAEVLYQTRFDKSVSNGLEQYWQRATHLVTSVESVSSGPRSMNFVLMDDADRTEVWRTIYWDLPLLLMHAVGVCEVVAAYVTEAPMPDFGPASLHFNIGLLTWYREQKRSKGEVSELGPFLDRTDQGLVCFCKYKFRSERHFREVYSKRVVRCPRCNRENTLQDLFENSGPPLSTIQT